MPQAIKDFSSKTMEAITQWSNIFLSNARKELSTQNSISSKKKSFKIKQNKQKTFSDKGKLREFITSRPVRRNIKRFLRLKENDTREMQNLREGRAKEMVNIWVNTVIL